MTDINWSRRKYSKEQFIEAWSTSLSIAQVADKLGCNKTGGGYLTLRSTADSLGLSREHMTGGAWNQGNRYRPIKAKRPLAEILVENSTYTSSYSLKLRLFREGVKEKKCEICDLVEWQGKPAPLALDHANGNRRDNRIENLRILCYNCHGLTETFGTRNRGAYDI